MRVRSIARSALVVGLTGTAIGHFVPRIGRGMAAMIPPGVASRSPVSRRAIVRFTGLCEAAGAAGLLHPRLRPAAAIGLVVFFVAVFPANVEAARHPDRFGRAAIPIVPRALAQLGLIALTAEGGRA